jgi:hypothetical protein
MSDTNALFSELLAAYRNADDPDRFLREFLLRLDDATTNAVVATERKLDRLDAARARLDAAREVPRPDTSYDDGDEEQEQERVQADDEAVGEADDEAVGEADDEAVGEADDEAVEDEAPAEPKKRRPKKQVAASNGR